ncbi:hypothetical protein [Thiobacillus sp.]|uniref:hypothetical protein n=1 Tax=Thiobacillus sp. TaxID=924 RepID=UPI0025E3EB15|nr:hypothetical protein [Thiobacillus sp.]
MLTRGFFRQRVYRTASSTDAEPMRRKGSLFEEAYEPVAFPADTVMLDSNSIAYLAKPFEQLREGFDICSAPPIKNNQKQNNDLP